MKARILIVDDEPDIRQTLGGILEDEGFSVFLADGGRAALRRLEESWCDLVILDIWMPGMDGLEILSRIKETHPNLPVIMISGHGTVETAVRAIKIGAYDYIEKPLHLDQVLLTVRRAIDLQTLQSENRALREKVESGHVIVGESPAMRALKEQIDRAAPTDGRVLITGENGAGKELVARQIHAQSTRADKPFIEVNCAAIPEELIESELFGHEKGAFTGATAKRRGKFDLADGGTIFLDEIADMSLRTQAKILRILQEQRFERVGGAETIPVDVRVLAATNKDLENQIRQGAFREDLYFRLNVIPINVPPLRERVEDIPKLVEFFAARYSQSAGIPRKHFDDEAVRALASAAWPGNVRELKNIVERLVIMTPGPTIGADAARAAIKPGEAAAAAAEEARVLDESSWKDAKVRFERAYLLRKLREHGGHVSRTAEAIGVERTHLHRRIKALGIDPSRTED
ncbi:sigma-54 dependent transcriptional regulator [bacterium]|nr:sigma-54 dependent transcriptional regulator [bacterium]